MGSLVTALYYQLLGTPDVVDRTHGHSPYDNRSVAYGVGTLALPVAALEPVIRSMIAASNVGVARYDITPDAQNYLNGNYLPAGDFQIPVMTVHNAWDPLVPFFHEPALAGLASGGGGSANLLQRTVVNYGHCNFSTPTVVSSFQTLAGWVTTGVKPAS